MSPIWYLLGAVFAVSFYGFLGSAAQFYARSFMYTILLAIGATYGVLASIFLTLIGKKGLSQWACARFFYYLQRVVMGIEVEILNDNGNAHLLDDIRPGVFVSNHQSEVDITILARTFPKYCSVTAKKALKHYPFLGWFMTLSGSIFLDRANRNDALKTFESACKQMITEKQSVFIFPEGTRSYSTTPTLLPFKKGAFHLAVDAQLPIVPYVASTYFSPKRIVSMKPKHFSSGKILISVLDPIETKGLTKSDVNDLVVRVETAMKKRLVELDAVLEKKSQ